MSVEFVGVRTLWTKPAARNGRMRVALNRNQFVVFVKDKLSAPDAAIWTNRACDLGIVILRLEGSATLRHHFRPGTVSPGTELFQHRPARNKLCQFHEFSTRSHARGKVRDRITRECAALPRIRIVLYRTCSGSSIRF